jgi:hypothetical protein
MTEAIIVALLSLAGTFAGAFSGMKLVTYRVEQLEKKVEKHNNLVERQYAIEKITAVLSEDLKVVNHRLEELERNNG